MEALTQGLRRHAAVDGGSRRLRVMWVGLNVCDPAVPAKGLLSGTDMRVFHAPTVDDACMARIEELGIQVVVLAGGKVSGPQIATLRQQEPSVAVVLCASLQDSALIAALAQGAHEVVTPGDACRLCRGIERALARVQGQRATRPVTSERGQVLDALSSGVIVVDANDVVVDLNARALEYLRVTVNDELVGRPLERVVPGMRDLLRDTPAAVQRSIALQLDKAVRTLGFSYTSSPTGDMRYVVFRDVTDMLEQTRVQRRNDQLAQVGEMAARLSHEIKNPLASVTAGLELLCTAGQLEPRMLEVVEAVQGEVEQLSSVVHQLLTAAREFDVVVSQGSVLPVVLEAVTSCRVLAEPAAIQVALHDDLGVDLLVAADSGWLRRALGNLLVNAIDAVGDNGKVSVRVRRLSDQELLAAAPGFPHEVVVIEVTDDGSGMPQQVAHRVFDPYFTTKRLGTGLGLSVAAEVINLFGGMLTMRTQVGVGTRFSVHLVVGGPVACHTEPRADGVVPSELSTRPAQLHATGRGSDAPRAATCETCDATLDYKLSNYWRAPVVMWMGD